MGKPAFLLRWRLGGSRASAAEAVLCSSLLACTLMSSCSLEEVKSASRMQTQRM